jgi:hypothetical protein
MVCGGRGVSGIWMLNKDGFNFRNADSYIRECTEGGDVISFNLLGCKVRCKRDEIISICSIRESIFREKSYRKWQPNRLWPLCRLEKLLFRHGNNPPLLCTQNRTVPTHHRTPDAKDPISSSRGFNNNRQVCKTQPKQLLVQQERFIVTYNSNLLVI